MAVRSQRVLAAFLAGDDRRPQADRRRGITITLAARPGHRRSERPPVRLFVGTEAAQFRAERAFVWSVERVRDPGRTYEIYLMRDFAGFKRRLWLTGFTNYRFAIPELAGGQGRAIYNDADQIYLDDPAKLFDTPMGNHGVLSIHDHDTSVMLIDCQRMVGLWNGDTARASRNRELEARMRAVPGLWGPLDAGWNARDEEYMPGESMLVHYTTIHTQPWRPFPQDYVYGRNPATDIWMRLEREADAAGFQLFNAARPSPDFPAPNADAQPRSPAADRLADYRRLLVDARATSLHYCGSDDPVRLRAMAAEQGLAGAAVSTHSPATERGATTEADVVAADGLEQLPDLDIPWLLDRLLQQAGRAVIVSIDLAGRAARRCPPDPLWWYAQMVAAGARHPHRHWRLLVRQPRLVAPARTRRWSGGALLNAPPTTWALLHYKTGHRSQALGVAEALGWPFATREIARTPLAYLAAFLRPSADSGARALPGGIAAPWPDVVIASGWLPGLVARWMVRRNHGNTRLILLGRRGGPVGESQHIGIHCRHFGLPPHPQHIEAVLPPNKASTGALQQAATRWPGLFGDAAGTHVALLVGGGNSQQSLNPDTATEMAARLCSAVRAAGGKLAVLTSRRTGDQATAALRDNAGDDAIIEAWQAGATDNPYLGYLAGADILVVTGESESMLAEAVATGKPVYIYPLPDSPPNARQRLANRVVRQARTDRYNARGSRRPQQGLQYLCARLVEQRLLLPQRDMTALHAALVEQGVARLFNGSLETWQPPPWREVETIAQRIRALWTPAAAAVEPSCAADKDRDLANA